MDNNLEGTGHEMEHGMEHEMEHGMGHRMTNKAVEFRFAEPQDVNLILKDAFLPSCQGKYRQTNFARFPILHIVLYASVCQYTCFLSQL